MKRLKKILKWTGLVLGGLVAILLLVNAWFVWSTDARLEKQLEAIRTAGDPLTLADLARKPIPPEQNAAKYLRRVEVDRAAMEKELKPYWEWADKHDENALMPADIQRSVKAVFDAHPRVIPLLQKAAACPEYDEQLDYSVPANSFLGTQLLPLVRKCKGAARLLQIESQLLALEGNPSEAVRSALAIFRLARHFDRNPTIISYLVAMAVRGTATDSADMALQTGPVSHEVRKSLDAELAVQEGMAGYTWALKSERAFGLDSFRTLPLRNLWFFSRGLWNQQESAYLDAMDAYVALTYDRGPYEQTEHIISRIYARIPVRSGTFAQLVFPAMKATHEAVIRTRAQIRCLRVLNAIQVRVPAGSKEVPKLSELGLPAEATTDPFNGEPLHVKRLPQGWLVYSVGSNLVDDGGKLDDKLSDIGVGPPKRD